MDADAVARLLEKADTPLAKLRVPFADNQIGLLPRAVSKNDTQKATCNRGGNVSVDGKFCGGYHTRSIHLDFVGHAALTDRLLEADPEWTWEPVAIDDHGLPLLDKFGGMWIRLTVGGVTRLGYGDAQGKAPSSTAMKEVIGDALRNAGMRFGVALDLWHKGDLHEFKEEQGAIEGEHAGSPAAPRKRAAAGAQKVSERDWLAELAGITNATDARALHTAAKTARVPETMLSTIVARGKELAAREESTQQEAPQGASALRRGFEGGEPE